MPHPERCARARYPAPIFFADLFQDFLRSSPPAFFGQTILVFSDSPFKFQPVARKKKSPSTFSGKRTSRAGILGCFALGYRHQTIAPVEVWATEEFSPDDELLVRLLANRAPASKYGLCRMLYATCLGISLFWSGMFMWARPKNS